MAPDPTVGPERVLMRFTSDHEDSGVLYQPGQEAWVSPAAADYIETVAKSGHRVTPEPAATALTDSPTSRGPRRGKE